MVAGDTEPGMVTPDFDAYPITHGPTAAEPFDRGVRVTWDDGLVSELYVDWLRENAPEPHTTHPVTREQSLPLINIPDDLSASAAAVGSDGFLEVTWSDGADSRYHPGWLRAHVSGGEPAFAVPSLRIWGAADLTDPPVFDGPKVLSDDDAFATWLEALHVEGLAILRGLPTTPDVIETVPARIGVIRETNFGPVFDVRSKADADSNAYTSMHLNLHTDLPTREYQPGLQFLHCLQNDAAGGDSLLADGFYIAERLSESDPDAFDALTTIPLTAANKARDTDYRWEAPMIALDSGGRPIEIRWSPFLRAPLRLPFETVARVYRALRAVFRLAESSEAVATVRLEAGDLLGFDNRRVLHGRTAFDPVSGGRWLRGCYVERDELLSRLRIAARRKRANL